VQAERRQDAAITTALKSAACSSSENHARSRTTAHLVNESGNGVALTFLQNRRIRMARKKAKATSEASTGETSIEQAMDELNGVVTALESGQESLDESLKLFERGMSLLRVCHRQLDAAAQRIEVITALDADGTVETAEFDGTATTGRSRAKKATRDTEGELF
jgi:exodeoxyribonuclease VII small subunit